MPSLSFFADEQDAKALLNWLNAEDEIAFIVSDQTQASCQHRWKAVHTIERFIEEKYSLWHVPTGSLPLLTKTGLDQIFSDPWKGWIEECPGPDSRSPYFGPGHPAEIRLELWLRHRPYSEVERNSLPILDSRYLGNTDLLSVSDFQWIGNRYKTSPPQTWRWWQRLKRWMAKNTTRLVEGKDSFWAFPSAFSKLSSGMAYEARGWNLDNAIRNAENRSD
ncbi:hypothetical protein H6F76_03750 [Leptolyngbya sp. FACHB-321]|uniref:hypothetical protein n=1 Tax=Leptolyngbya sp. FACHB-321 TaxID=2692807 RepID=UPI001687C150|nr:hypothetical protein [Leptolyngbya sp. FACHB-321]MBD2034160.1 hypothetical protein [Leptolyngbya sp. FACHB-321]